MSRENKKSLKSLKTSKVSTSIAVLLPSDFEEAQGVSFTKEGGRLHGGQVRVIHEQELNSMKRLSGVAGGSPGWLDFLCGVKKLQGLEDELQDPIEYRRAWELIAPKFGFNPKESAPPRNLKKSLLLPALAVAFEGVRMTFWYTKPDKHGKQRLLPGLHCPDNKTAVAARWLLDRNLRICTHCQTIFLATRPKQTAHSVECREAHRAARWHARRRLMEAA